MIKQLSISNQPNIFYMTNLLSNLYKVNDSDTVLNLNARQRPRELTMKTSKDQLETFLLKTVLSYKFTSFG